MYIQLEGPWDICPGKLENTSNFIQEQFNVSKNINKWFSEEEIDDEDIFLVSVDGIHCHRYEV